MFSAIGYTIDQNSKISFSGKYIDPENRSKGNKIGCRRVMEFVIPAHPSKIGGLSAYCFQETI
jgi:hypothetical protein